MIRILHYFLSRISFKLSLILILFFSTDLAHSATITWDGSESSDWETAANWDTNQVPNEGDDVVIPATTLTNFNAPTIASLSVVAVNNLTISSNARIEIGPSSGGEGSTLMVMGDVVTEGLIRANENSSMVLMGSFTGSGNGIYANSRTVYGDLSYSIFSIPFSDGNIGLFNGVFSYGYDNDTGNFTPLSFSSGTVSGQGYFVALAGFGETFTLGFAGSPYGADIDVPVSLGSFDNFNLVGNPYTAAIDVSAFLANANNQSNTTGVIYFWDDGGQNAGRNRGGDYITVNSMGTVGTQNLSDGISGKKGTAVYEGSIATMQGFFIEATNNGTVSFTRSMQIAGQNEDVNFYRNAQTTDERTKIRLSLQNENSRDELLIGFDADATEGVDYSLDARELAGYNPVSFYSFYDNNRYAIRALPVTEDAKTEIPLGYDVEEQGIYHLIVDAMENLPSGQEVFLFDKATGNTYPLSVGLKVDLEMKTLNNDSRLFLLLHPAETTVETDHAFDQLKIVGAEQNSLIIGSDKAEDYISLYDLQGKIIYEDHIVYQDNRATIPVRLDKNKVYILQSGSNSIKFSINR